MRPFEITAEVFREAQALHRRRRSVVVSAVVSVAVASIALVETLDELGASAVVGAVVGGVVGGLVAFLVGERIADARSAAVHREQRSLHGEIRVRFDDEHVEWHTVSGHARIPWQALVRVQRGRGLFLLYEARNLLRIVPASAFEDVAERERFEACLARSVPA